MSSPTERPAPLTLDAMDPDAHNQFTNWFAAAKTSGVHEPEAVALATADASGRPSVRMVLLRGHGPNGYVWFTNSLSRKGRDVAENPWAALVAHWASIGRQVRIEGTVRPVSEARADEYFASRERESQLGAWASNQSAPLATREELLDRFAAASARFGSGPVQRPPHWGGYILDAQRIEFWQHGDHRLHDRVEYIRLTDGTWSRRLVNP